MELTGRIVSREAKYIYSGRDNVEVTEGKSFKIETSPNGDEILDVECPAGKRWNVYMRIYISETDAQHSSRAQVLETEKLVPGQPARDYFQEHTGAQR